MTKSELIAEVQSIADITAGESQMVVEVILDSIVEALRKGDKVEVRHFGTFGTRVRGARIGHNPKTGARVEVSAKRIPFFKPSSDLKSLAMIAPGAGLK
jgi:integration host factor subunit beta